MEYQFDLVIDIGNTRTKLGWFVEGRCMRTEKLNDADIQGLNLLLKGDVPHAIVVGSVAMMDKSFLEDLHGLAPVLEVNARTQLPIRNGYGTPETLGVDRIANAAGAWKLFPGRASLIIDAGTCITYDLVDHNGEFVGGAISPGERMRAQAMHAYSARLPLVTSVYDPPLIGATTSAALASGVHHGMIQELKGMISAFRHHRPDLVVILTGGDALNSARALKNGIFAHPILTLEGLHAILVHNRDAHGIAGNPASHGGISPRSAG